MPPLGLNEKIFLAHCVDQLNHSPYDLDISCLLEWVDENPLLEK